MVFIHYLILLHDLHCFPELLLQMVRHTTMIVGPTGGGKSLILETLKNARLPAEGVNVKYFVLNAKKQTLGELYGVMDPVTRDWTDGILSKLFRELHAPLPRKACYTFFVLLHLP